MNRIRAFAVLTLSILFAGVASAQGPTGSIAPPSNTQSVNLSLSTAASFSLTTTAPGTLIVNPANGTTSTFTATASYNLASSVNRIFLYANVLPGNSINASDLSIVVGGVSAGCTFTSVWNGINSCGSISDGTGNMAAYEWGGLSGSQGSQTTPAISFTVANLGNYAVGTHAATIQFEAAAF